MDVKRMLEGKVAIVTGGTRGIGFSIVKKFLNAGASVVLCGSRQESVEKALGALKEENSEYPVTGMWPELTDYAAVEKAAAEVKEKFGKIDILVNNAGISARESIYDYKPEDFARIMNLNVNAVFYFII